MMEEYDATGQSFEIYGVETIRQKILDWTPAFIITGRTTWNWLIKVVFARETSKSVAIVLGTPIVFSGSIPTDEARYYNAEGELIGRIRNIDTQ